MQLLLQELESENRRQAPATCPPEGVLLSQVSNTWGGGVGGAEVQERKGGISGDGRRLDLGRWTTTQYTDDVL